MARGEDQTVLRDQAKHFFHLREQLSITCDTDERSILFRVPHLILRIERRHPYKPSPSSRDFSHVCHSRGVYSTNREVQVDSAEHFQTRYFLSHQIRKPTSRIVVVL